MLSIHTIHNTTVNAVYPHEACASPDLVFAMHKLPLIIPARRRRLLIPVLSPRQSLSLSLCLLFLILRDRVCGASVNSLVWIMIASIKVSVVSGKSDLTIYQTD